MKVLVLYETLPEENTIAIVDLTKEVWDEIKCAHGYTVGISGEEDENKIEAVLKIGDALLKPESLKYAENKEWAGVWYEHIVDVTDKPINLTDVKRMIVCGICV